jgi:hypothetical protein
MIVKLKTYSYYKTAWDVVKLETSRNTNNENMCTLNVDGKINRNQQEIVDTFNKYMDK